MFKWLNSSTWSVLTYLPLIETSTLDDLRVQYWDSLHRNSHTSFDSMYIEIHTVVHLQKLISCSNEWYLGSVENTSLTIADNCSLDIDYWLFVSSFVQLIFFSNW